MNNRERILAAAIAALLLLLLAGYAFTSVTRQLRVQRNAVAKLQDEIRDKQRTIQFAAADRERLDRFEAMSLVSDPEKARSLYQKWLLDLVTNTAQLVDPQINVVQSRGDNKVYYQLGFTVTGQGDLRQLVDFLYHFYSADILHRIQRLTLKRIPSSKRLDITVSVEALALKSGPAERDLEQPPKHQLTRGTRADYAQTILERNLSGQPNRAPELASSKSPEAKANEAFTMKLDGRDPDKGDRIRYRLEGDELFGAQVHEESGEFQWRPEKPGEYRFVVVATDDGIPERSARETMTIRVVERQPEPPAVARLPDFSKAKFAFLTAITETEGRRQAWISLRTDGKVLKLFEGEQFDLGEVKVTVRQIGDRAVTLDASPLEKSLTVPLGGSLAEGEQPSGESS